MLSFQSTGDVLFRSKGKGRPEAPFLCDELWLQIVSDLSVLDVKSLALTCKQLWMLLHPIVFRRIVITSDYSHYWKREPLAVRMERSKRRLSQLSRVRAIAKGDIYPNPGELWVSSQRYQNYWDQKMKGNRRLVDAVFDLLKCPSLQNLTHLRLANVFISAKRSKVLAGMRSLKSVEFHRCSSSYNEGDDVYSALRVSQLRLVDSPLWWPVVCVEPVEELEVRVMDGCRWFTSIVSGPLYSSLKVLTVGNTHVDITTLRRLLTHAPVLQELRIVTHNTFVWSGTQLADPMPRDILPPIKRFAGPDYLIGLFGIKNDLEDVELWGTVQNWGLNDTIEASLSHLRMAAPNVRALRLRIPHWTGDRIVQTLAHFPALEWLDVNTYLLRDDEEVRDTPLRTRLVSLITDKGCSIN